MLQYSRSYTRPSTSVDWWFEQTLSVDRMIFRNRMQEAFYATGKVILENTQLSQDGLVWTWTGIWLDEAAFNEYDVDPVLNLYWTVKDEYNDAVGIIKGPLEVQNV